MPRSESYSELWVNEEQQLPAELRLQLLDLKYALYAKPDAGTPVTGAPEGTREYDTGTLTITYSFTRSGDTDAFVFIALHKSQQRLFVVPRDVFVSYSHQDADWFDPISKLLARIEKAGDTTFWTDRKIKAGERWLDVIRERLDKATAAILLMSHSFLERPFICDEELPVLLDKADEAHEARQARKAGKSRRRKGKSANGHHGFLLSWVPVKQVEPHRLKKDKHKEHWDRISQHQALGNPAEPLAHDEQGKTDAQKRRTKLKRLEKNLLDFLQHAFEAERP